MSAVDVPGLDPEALALERALLGGTLFLAPREWPVIYAEQFALPRHQTIFQAVQDLTEITDRPDVALLADELRHRGVLEEVGGPPYLAQLVEDGYLTIPYHLRAYAARIRQRATERNRLALAAEILRHPEGSGALRALLEALEAQPGHTEPLTVAFDNLSTAPDPLIETGLGLDLIPKTVTVLGGQTSHGKTALMLELAVRLAEAGRWVEFVTLEDPKEAIAARLIARRTGLTVFAVRRSRMRGVAVEGARAYIEALPLSVTEVLGCREDAVIGTVAASQASVVMVDYIQKIAFEDGDSERRTISIGRVMSRLSSIARRDDKALLAASQLKQEMEAQKRPPQLSDFADSAEIARQARQVWAGYWPAKHSDKAEPRDYIVRKLKVSEGPTYPVELHWSARSGQFWLPSQTPGESNDGW